MSKFFITENEKNIIRKMYGLIIEQKSYRLDGEFNVPGKLFPDVMVSTVKSKIAINVWNDGQVDVNFTSSSYSNSNGSSTLKQVTNCDNLSNGIIGKLSDNSNFVNNDIASKISQTIGCEKNDNTKGVRTQSGIKFAQAANNREKPTVQTYKIPAELKDVNGIKSFQTWLDNNHPGWVKKYGKLEGKPERGYGKFGPNTNRAWNSQWGKDYLNSLSSNNNSTTQQSTLTNNNDQEYQSSGNIYQSKIYNPNEK